MGHLREEGQGHGVRDLSERREVLDEHLVGMGQIEVQREILDPTVDELEAFVEEPDELPWGDGRLKRHAGHQVERSSGSSWFVVQCVVVAEGEGLGLSARPGEAAVATDLIGDIVDRTACQEPGVGGVVDQPGPSWWTLGVEVASTVLPTIAWWPRAIEGSR